VKLSRQNLLLVGLGLALLGLLVWAFLPAAVEVDLGRVERGRLLVSVEHEGKTRVRERYVVSSPLAGRLLRVGLHPGDAVVAGKTLLAVIEPADPALLDARARAQAEARVEQALAARKQAASNLERARPAHLQAARELQRARRLRPGGSASEQEYEVALYREQAAAAEVRAGEFALRVAEFEVEQARAALIHSRPRSPGEQEPFRFDIPAPVTGVVLRVFQESATVVTPGTRLLEVGDPIDLECEIDVLSTDAVKVRPGQRAVIEHWGGTGALQGRVRVREPSAFTKVSALGVEEQRVNIIIDLTDPPGRRPTLGDGYRVEARIVVWEGPDVLKVPSGALFRRGDGWAVFRVQRGKATPRVVTVGQDNGLEAEILEGLDEGDQVVLHPSDRVRDGAAVVPRPAR
jgi:HlyD family secretion protein